MQRNGKRWISVITYSVAALLLFCVLLALTFRSRRQVDVETRVRVMMMGDSIPGASRDETSITALLGQLLGEPVFNGSLGGTGMSRLDREGRLAYTKDCLSMQALSQAIATKDFGVQQTVYSREAATGYFSVAIDMMETVDYDGLEVLIIEHGINDYHAGVPLENPEDDLDVHTFTGALRSSVLTLQEAYPDLRIVLLTPTYSWYPDGESSGLTCEEYDLGGGVLEDYVNAELDTARELGIDVIDVYHGLYPHEEWSDWELYTEDGLHPNEEGRRRIAWRVYEYLREVLER